MDDKRYQVFVSSTYKDLKTHRQTVINELMALNAIPVGMELFPSTDENAWAIITSYIDLSDYYVVIIGGLYGSVNPETGLSYTEMEYDYAVSKGIPVMAFLHENEGQLPRDLTERNQAKVKKLKSLKEKAKLKHCNFYTDEKDLALKVNRSYSRMVVRHPGIGWIRGDQAKTREDAERMAYLERRIGELERELSISNEFILLYKDCMHEFKVSYKMRIFEKRNGALVAINDSQSIHSITLKVNDILTDACDLIIDGSRETNIFESIISYHVRPSIKSEQFDITTNDGDISAIRRFLILRGLITQGSTRCWNITDKCKAYLLHLQQGKFDSIETEKSLSPIRQSTSTPE